MIKLQWKNTDSVTASALDLAVKFDITWNLNPILRDPSLLIFHHVFLTKDYDGPCVCVWGVEGSDAFHCEYVEKPQWSNLL